MWFLVDFENVHEEGLRGLEYLTAEDSLALFYSNACKTVSQKYWELIVQSGCYLEAYCLEHSGKNALDFCISTKVGEIFSTARRESVAIISNDKGYKAVRDYWRGKKHGSHSLVLQSSIEKSIISANACDLRWRRVKHDSERLDLSEVTEKFFEHQRVREELKVFLETEGCSDLIEDAMKIVSDSSTPKERYQNSLKEFGRSQGIKVYHAIKQVV